MVRCSRPLTTYPAPGLRGVLHGEVSLGVVADRIDGDPVALVQLRIVLFEGAQDHCVASATAQEIVNLLPHFVVAAHTAARLHREPVDAGGQLVEWRCLGGNLTECLQLRHGRSPSRVRGLSIQCLSTGLVVHVSARVLLRDLTGRDTAQVRCVVGLSRFCRDRCETC